MFGPVFSLVKYKTDEEAINIANNTNYGLGASIMSKDIDKAEKMAA
ncbi:MAG: aldehyde dehydrogenase family protein [bacterium]